ncbi:MAG TPA: hypothetical protein VMS55_11295 [Myxococcota bacterium]|nr:hypothetical protein [Myxococcota bacterium]
MNAFSFEPGLSNQPRQHRAIHKQRLDAVPDEALDLPAGRRHRFVRSFAMRSSDPELESRET